LCISLIVDCCCGNRFDLQLRRHHDTPSVKDSHTPSGNYRLLRVCTRPTSAQTAWTRNTVDRQKAVLSTRGDFQRSDPMSRSFTGLSRAAVREVVTARDDDRLTLPDVQIKSLVSHTVAAPAKNLKRFVYKFLTIVTFVICLRNFAAKVTN